jgi:hypothetical protein
VGAAVAVLPLPPCFIPDMVPELSFVEQPVRATATATNAVAARVKRVLNIGVLQS